MESSEKIGKCDLMKFFKYLFFGILFYIVIIF